VVRALKGANVPGLGWVVPDFDACDAALYPTEGREDLTDPDTLRHDYRRYDGDGPTEWWADARVLQLRFMRQAGEKDLLGVMADLEGLRERVTLQQILGECDYERRYVAPRRAAREGAVG